jgi:predicted GH43/DUF377 family glycosyl hydrolase
MRLIRTGNRACRTCNVGGPPPVPPRRRLLASAGALLIAVLGSCGTNPAPTEKADGWNRHAANPIITAGIPVYPGGPTAISVSDPDVIYDEISGAFRMWFAVAYFDGPAGNEELFTAVKHAESQDGFSWTVSDEPALTAATSSDAWDYTSTETPSVVVDPNASAENRYRLYYGGGNVNVDPLGDYPRFQIGCATSTDGYTFTRISATDSPYGEEGLVLRVEDSLPAYSGTSGGEVTTGAIADPEVELVADEFLLWFTVIGLDSSDNDVAGGIGLARSTDGVLWSPDAENPIDSIKRFGDDPTFQPSVVVHDSGSYDLWYNADLPSEVSGADLGPNGTIGFFKAEGSAPDSFSLPTERSLVYDPDYSLERRGFSVGVDAIVTDGLTRLYYGSLADSAVVDFPENPWEFTYVLCAATEER